METMQAEIVARVTLEDWRGQDLAPQESQFFQRDK